MDLSGFENTVAESDQQKMGIIRKEAEAAQTDR